MYDYLCKHQIPISRIHRQVHVYTPIKGKYLRKHQLPLFVHAKMLIVDHREALSGSTNVWDRSHTVGNDIELSVHLRADISCPPPKKYKV